MSSEGIEQQNQQTPGSPNQFVSRVSNLPVVHTALDYTASGYERIKETHEIVNYTLTQVENSIKYTAEQAKPAIQKLEKPIQLADQMACNGLDKLEEKLPIINKPPEEIVDDTKKICASTVQAGLSTYQEMKKLGSDKLSAISSYGTAKAQEILESTYGQFILHSAEGAVKATERCVDYLLPPAEDESGEQKTEDANLVSRVESLSKKAKDRIYKKAIEQLESLQKHSQEALQNMKYAIDLIQYAKALDRRTGISDAVTAVQDKAAWLWNELNKEEPISEDTKEKTLEQQVLFIARRATKQLVHTYTTYVTTLQNVPQNIQERLSVGKQYVFEMYNQFSQTSRLADISAAVLKQTQEKISYIQESLASLVNSMIRTDTLRFWTKKVEDAKGDESEEKADSSVQENSQTEN